MTWDVSVSRHTTWSVMMLSTVISMYKLVMFPGTLLYMDKKDSGRVQWIFHADMCRLLIIEENIVLGNRTPPDANDELQKVCVSYFLVSELTLQDMLSVLQLFIILCP